MVRVKFNLPQRVKNILLAPRKEWAAIAREFTEPAFLFARYVAVLALIPALAGFVSRSLIGVQVSIGMFHEPVAMGLAKAAIDYLLSFVIVYLVALAINLLGRYFGGRGNFMSALKLSVYAHTPVWLAGIFLVLPGLHFLAFSGLYAGYLLWTGFRVLLGMPARRAAYFAATIVGIGLAISIALSFAVSLVLVPS